MGIASRDVCEVVAAKGACRKGQMAVELAVALPVLRVVALVVTNAGLLLSECAAFDRAVRNAVRICAASPERSVDADVLAQRVEQLLAAEFDAPYIEVSVEAGGSVRGHGVYTASMEFRPTLFGLGLRTHFLGVSVPPVTHEVSFAVDAYKPGVVI